MPREIGGVEYETVGDILGDQPPPKVGPFTPATLEGTPPLPEPGIYFGMPEETYHALPALGSGGVKEMAASPTIFWANCGWLSEKKRKKQQEAAEEREHHVLGKAYHCRVMEGLAEFNRRFVVELDPAEYPEALVHTDQIKAAIARHETESTLKKDAGTGRMVPVRPWSKVEDFMPDTGEAYQRSAVKADWIRQLRELEPEAVIFDCIQADFLSEHQGKAVLSLEAYEQIEIAARMIERDPEVSEAFKGGHPEVTLIWYCEKTGAPMKARVDYLKIEEAVDLKTLLNRRQHSMEQAIRFEISGYRYNFQPNLYVEGIKAVRQLVREFGTRCIHFPDQDQRGQEYVDFALKWAAFKGELQWLWVFQQKGDAPITRGVRYPLEGITSEDTYHIVDRAKRRFVQFSEVFGTDMWLDTAPIYTIADEDIPRQATEI